MAEKPRSRFSLDVATNLILLLLLSLRLTPAHPSCIRRPVDLSFRVSQDACGRYVAAGIMSRGSGCGHKDYPGHQLTLPTLLPLDQEGRVRHALNGLGFGCHGMSRTMAG